MKGFKIGNRWNIHTPDLPHPDHELAAAVVEVRGLPNRI
jgi:hypothetical protein